MKASKFHIKHRCVFLFIFVISFAIFAGSTNANDSENAESSDITIRFLYTSDTESEFLPFETRVMIHSERRNVTAGGYLGLSTLLKQKRAENIPSMTLSGGDDPLGRFFNYFKGVATHNLIDKMGYDVFCPGNHDFDKGEEAFAKALEGTKRDVVCANVQFHNEYLAERIKPSVIKEIGGLKVGFFGLLTPTVSFISSIDRKSIVNTDLKSVALKQIEDLKGKGADIIAAITHMGEPEDVKLATEVSGIHIIFGAHSHRYTEEPVYVTRDDGWRTIVVNGGQKAVYLCKLDLTIEKTDNDVQIKKVHWELVPNFNGVEPDEELKKYIDEYVAKMPAEIVVAKALVNLNNAESRFKESNIGNLVCDMLLERFNDSADICIYNSGGIRISIQEGDITSTMLENMMPFGNAASIVTVKGKVFKSVFERSAASIRTGAFLHFSKNIRVVYDLSAEPQIIDPETRKITQQGNRVKSILIDGKQVEPEKEYRIITNSFVADGGDGYIMLADYPSLDTYLVVKEIIQESFQNMGEVTSDLDGRISFVSDATDEDKDKQTKKPETSKKDKGRERKIVYTANYTIHVEDIEKATDRTKALLYDYQGEIKEETNYSLILRVPPANFDLFTNALRKTGKILNRHRKSEDISEQYYDLALRINSKRDTLKSYEGLMQKAQTVKDMLDVQREIRLVIGEIERMEGRLKLFNYSTARATTNINWTSEVTVDRPVRRYHTPYYWVNYLGIDRLLGDMTYED